MRQYWGVVVGAALGLLGGVWGMVFGAFIGLLADLVLADLRVQRESLRFIESGIRPSWLDPALPLAGAFAQLIHGPAELDAGEVERIERELASMRNDRYAARLSERMIASGARAVAEAAARSRVETHLDAVRARARESLAESVRERVLAAAWRAPQREPTPAARDRARGVARDLGLNDSFINDVLSVRPVLDPASCEMLGVSRDASLGDVRTAYRALVSQFHPDTAGDLSPEQQRTATEAFVRIQSAYERLRDQLRA